MLSPPTKKENLDKYLYRVESATKRDIPAFSSACTAEVGDEKLSERSNDLYIFIISEENLPYL